MKTFFINQQNRDQVAKELKQMVLAVGFFDGVHLGHQKVIQTAKKIADEQQLKLGVMTFSPHPHEVLSKGEKIVQYLTPLSVKEKVFHSLHVDYLFVVKFNQAFSTLQPEQFVQQYFIDFQVKHVVAGFDFTYGATGKGNMNRLYHDSGKKIKVTTVEKVSYDKQKISSTLIRGLLNKGAVEEIPHYLGRNYVTEGIGRILNHEQKIIVIPKHHYTCPKQGLYRVELCLGKRVLDTLVYVKDSYVFLHDKINSIKEGECVSIHWKEFVSQGEPIVSNV
ncbi:MAG TPA: FAD synthetase family protein [Bacilli bacterium]|nr:FAD synthetase family protein [Bacilli bacterium]